MKKYKVVWSDYYNQHETIVEAETKSKATYKVFKSLLGEHLAKSCKFIEFIKYFYTSTSEVNDGN